MISFSFCSNCFLLSCGSTKRAYFWLNYRFCLFCAACQRILFCTCGWNIYSSGLALRSDTVFSTIQSGGTWFIFRHINRKTSGLVRNATTCKSDLLLLISSITRHCKRLNFGFLIYNVSGRRCTVLVRILIIQFLWAFITKILTVFTVWCIKFVLLSLKSLFLVPDVVCNLDTWAFIWNRLLSLAAADSIQFDLLLDHFVHLLCHLTTLK